MATALNQRKSSARIRAEMIAAYGGCCLHCGEDDPIVLVIDHINNDRKSDMGLAPNGLNRRLKRLGWPKDRYQLLCHNCNYRKEYFRRKQLGETIKSMPPKA